MSNVNREWLPGVAGLTAVAILAFHSIGGFGNPPDFIDGSSATIKYTVVT